MNQYELDDPELQEAFYHYQDALQAFQDYDGQLQPYTEQGTLNTWEEFSFVFPQCFYPVLRQGVFEIVGRLIGLSLVLRALCVLGFRAGVLHCASALLGSACLWLFYDVGGTAFFWLFCIGGYLTLRAAPKRRGVYMAAYVIMFLFTR